MSRDTERKMRSSPYPVRAGDGRMRQRDPIDDTEEPFERSIEDELAEIHAQALERVATGNLLAPSMPPPTQYDRDRADDERADHDDPHTCPDCLTPMELHKPCPSTGYIECPSKERVYEWRNEQGNELI